MPDLDLPITHQQFQSFADLRGTLYQKVGNGRPLNRCGEFANKNGAEITLQTVNFPPILTEAQNSIHIMYEEYKYDTKLCGVGLKFWRCETQKRYNRFGSLFVPAFFVGP